MPLIKRPYQQDWLRATSVAYSSGITRQLGRAATGLGKTVLFANLPEELKLQNRMMVLVHREELASQAADKIRLWNPTLTTGIEMGEFNAQSSDQIVVAGIQSIGRLGNSRLKQFNPLDFGALVCDEAHHSAATTYRNVFEYFGFQQRKELLTLGVTATPSRSDGKGLSDIYQKIVFDMPLIKGIREGWLADIRAFRVKTKVDISSVTNVGGDFNQGQLAGEVNTPARNDQIVREWMAICPDRQTVVFTVDIQHAKDLADAFKGYGVVAEAVWGDDPHRAEKLKAHREGRIRVLTNCQILTEGYDDPGLSCIVMAKPTQSASLYEQMIGRGTRLPFGINNLLEALRAGVHLSKIDCIIIDVVDLSKRLTISSISSLFGMGELDLKGRSVVQAKDKFEELERKSPGVDLLKADDFDKLDSFVESVDLFKVEYPPEIIQISEYQWHRGRNDSYVLLLAGRDNVVVLKDMLDRWNIVGDVNGKKFQSGNKNFDDAIREADQLVKICGGRSVVSIASRDAKWHKDKPKPAQLTLCQRLRIHVPNGATRGEVSAAINNRLHELKQTKAA